MEMIGENIHAFAVRGKEQKKSRKCRGALMSRVISARFLFSNPADDERVKGAVRNPGEPRPCSALKGRVH